jgi:hypothetical protein
LEELRKKMNQQWMDYFDQDVTEEE